MRKEHCEFAKLNQHGRCIAICHYNCIAVFVNDCKGIKREREKDIELAGREYQIGGRFKKHATKLYSS